MHQAFHKEIVRSITRSWSRFLAIFAIVALGAGFYAGLRMASPDMRATIDAYADDTALMDVHLVSTLGFSDEDVRAVEAVEGVKAVMPAHITDVTATFGDRRETARVHGLDIAAAQASDTSSGGSAISSDPAYLNRPILVEGRWPEQPGECLVDSSQVLANTAQIGDTVTITDGVVDPADMFERTTFTVVGVVDSSYYLSVSRGTTTLNDGNVDRVVYIAESDFADPGTYTDLFLAVAGAAEVPAFDDEYDRLVSEVVAVLEDMAPEREATRLAEVKVEAQEELDEGRAEYDDARAEADAEFADAQAELDDAAAEIAQAEKDLASGQRSYDSGVAQLAKEKRAFARASRDAQAEIDAGRAEIERQQAGLDQLARALPGIAAQAEAAAQAVSDLEAAYEAALAAESAGATPAPSAAELAGQLEGARAQHAAAEEAYATQSATYEAGIAGIAAARLELDAGQAELDAGTKRARSEFAAAQRKLDAAKRDLASGRAELADGKKEYEDGVATFEREKADAEAELADARAEIEDAQAEIDDIEAPTWYVLDRSHNMGYASFTSDAERIEAIGLLFPLLFFLVAALVALTTMTRMVDEERTLIGTYKALGYSKNRITGKYLVYAGVASISGSIVGIIIGSQVLPKVVWYAYTTMYTAPAALTPIDIPLALLAGVSAVGVTTVATLFAVEADLRESPAALMLPRAPKAGKRILLERLKPVWSRMSFSHKVTARNLFRYKKRLLMTIVGIAGCTALLLTGFGIKDSIGDILAIQYGEIYRYNMTVGLDDGIPEGGEVESLLGDPSIFSDYLATHVEGVRITNTPGLTEGMDSGEPGAVGSSFGGMSGGTYSDTTVDGHLLFAGDVSRLPEFIDLRERLSGDPVTLDDSGIVLTEKVAATLEVDVGDEVYIERLDDGGKAGESDPIRVEVRGVTEQYVVHYAYITPDLYERLFGELPEPNQVLARAVDLSDTSRTAISERLLAQEGVTTVQYNDDVTRSFDDMLASLDTVVVVLIISAGMLAFIVLYNLTNINVMERRREIATIKVLGFYDPEVNAYIYRETAALTVMGSALGLGLGVLMTRWVISTVEVDIVMFGRSIHGPSFVYAAALTLLFALIVNLAMAPRLRSIDMVESLKSVE